MPFIPHTEEDVAQMLATLGVPGIEALFDEIPAELRCGDLPGIPAGLNEMQVARLLAERAAQDKTSQCFAGAALTSTISRRRCGR